MRRTEIGAFVLFALLARPQASEWRRIEPGLALVYPADHGAHPDCRIEWWYVTGQLEDESGARFGFQFTVFRRGIDARPAVSGDSALRAHELYAGHLALTDVARAETRFAERARRGSSLARASRTDLELALEDWSLARGANDELRLSAADAAADIRLALELRPSKPLVLHGDHGCSAKGVEPGNASAYVSWTRLAVAGSLADADGAHLVHGTAWFDHEFGSSVLEPGTQGWDWFGLQLDDGRELMLFVLRDARGAALAASAATLVERDGSARSLQRDEFTLAAGASWKSARSGAVYPARWTISVPGAGLRLELAPLVPDCELISATVDVTYWEGPVAVSGTLTGRGYAELTGYAGTMAGHF